MALRVTNRLLGDKNHDGPKPAGTFVTSDTTWNHFCHFRTLFETHGLPEIIYTDGLSLFGSSLLDLHFSLRGARRVNNDKITDLEGQNYEISTTFCKSVSIGHHPNHKFWVVKYPPKAVCPPILETFSL